jgi:hypothetical protein
MDYDGIEGLVYSLLRWIGVRNREEHGTFRSPQLTIIFHYYS